ncbi:MAG: type II toxin-antitoxin system PemK/MazF family toxin [Planctomycetia bacterium]
MIATSEPQPVAFGDIWVCRFPFTSGKGEKARPVLVILDLGMDCLVCRITSMPHFEPLDYAPADWQQAGLDRPSTIRITRLVTIEKSVLRARIGQLSEADGAAVKTLWNQKFRL